MKATLKYAWEVVKEMVFIYIITFLALAITISDVFKKDTAYDED